MNEIFNDLVRRHPTLDAVVPEMKRTLSVIAGSMRNNGTLFTCGNGGSGADADHIAGELLKGFLKKRPLDSELAEKMKSISDEGQILAENLQQGLRCISLLSHPALTSAFGNDVDPELAFAQQLLALGRKGDVLIGISTSGNAANIRKAFVAAKAVGIATVLMTGVKNGTCRKFADIVIAAPEKETYLVQELHLPIYHALCQAIEAEFFNE